MSYVQSYRRSRVGMGAIARTGLKTSTPPVVAPRTVAAPTRPVVVAPVQTPKIVAVPPLTLPPVVVKTLPPLVTAPPRPAFLPPPVVLPPPPKVSAPPLTLPQVVVQTLPPVVTAPPRPLIMVAPAPPAPPLTLPPAVVRTLPPVVTAPFVPVQSPIRTIIQPASSGGGIVKPVINTSPGPVNPALIRPVVAATKDAAAQISTGTVKPGTLADTIIRTAAQITGQAPTASTLATAVKTAAAQINAGTVKPGTFASVIQEAAVIKGAQAPLIKPVIVSQVKPATPPPKPVPIIPILNAGGIREVIDLPPRKNPPPLLVPPSKLPPKQLTIANPTPKVIRPTVAMATTREAVVNTPAGPVVVPSSGGGGGTVPVLDPETLVDEAAESAPVIVPPNMQPAPSKGLPGWAWLLGGGLAVYALTRK